VPAQPVPRCRRIRVGNLCLLTRRGCISKECGVPHQDSRGPHYGLVWEARGCLVAKTPCGGGEGSSLPWGLPRRISGVVAAPTELKVEECRAGRPVAVRRLGTWGTPGFSWRWRLHAPWYRGDHSSEGFLLVLDACWMRRLQTVVGREARLVILQLYVALLLLTLIQGPLGVTPWSAEDIKISAGQERINGLSWVREVVRTHCTAGWAKESGRVSTVTIGGDGSLRWTELDSPSPSYTTGGSRR